MRSIIHTRFMLPLLLAAVLFTSCSDQKSPATTIITPTIQSKVLAPTSLLSPTPIPQLPILGDNLAAFEQAYGKPSDTLGYSYMWITSPNDPYLEMSTDQPNGNAYEITQHYYLLKNPIGQGNVSLGVAQAACEKYKPKDSQLISKTIHTQRDQGGLAPGIQYIYRSTTLIDKLSPGYFVADDGSQVAPGTYTLFYLGTDATGYEQCFLQAGVNWPS